MFENGRPRYWIDWYDPWYLFLPLLLAVVLVALRWYPQTASTRSAARTATRVPALSPTNRPILSGRPVPTNPLPPAAPTTLITPANGKGFYQSRIPDAEGLAEAGALVHLDYANLDLVWHELAEMQADATGRFHFQLRNFPPGNYRLRARTVTAAGRIVVSGENMITIFADPAREPRRRSRRP